MLKKTILFIFILFSVQITFAGNDFEVEKLQWHFNRLDSILREVDTSELTEKQKENRIKNLDLLKKYSESGKFPNNDKFPGEYVPFFKGSNGNLCAVGYLMNSDPEYQSFVAETVNVSNNIKVMDIRNNDIFDSWLNKNGFTQLEAAIIQPSYGYCWYRECSSKCENKCTSFERKLLNIGISNPTMITTMIPAIIKFIMFPSYDSTILYMIAIIILFSTMVCIVIGIYNFFIKKIKTKKYFILAFLFLLLYIIGNAIYFFINGK